MAAPQGGLARGCLRCSLPLGRSRHRRNRPLCSRKIWGRCSVLDTCCQSTCRATLARLVALSILNRCAICGAFSRSEIISVANWGDHVLDLSGLPLPHGKRTLASQCYALRRLRRCQWNGLRKPRAELIRDLEYAIAHGLDLESIEGSLEFARTTLGVRLSLHKKNARGYRATLARCVHESSFVGHGQTHEAVKKLREVLRGFNRHQSFEMVGGLSEAAAVLVANGDHLEYLDCGIALVSNIRGAPHRLFLRTSMVKSEICEFLGIRVGAIRMATQEPPNFSTPSAARRELEELAERGGLH